MFRSVKAETPGYVIEMTAKQLKRAFQATLTDLGAEVTVDQWVVMDLVRKQPGMSQQQIASDCGKDKPTVTRILDRLEAKNLVERRPIAGDRRKFGIHLSARGRAASEQLMPEVKAFRLRHFEGLDDDDVQNLLRILGKINENITKNNQHRHALSQAG